MTGAIHFGEAFQNLRVTTGRNEPGIRHEAAPLSPYGAEVRGDGVVLTGPAAFTLSPWAELSKPAFELVSTSDEMALSVRLPLAGGRRPIELDATLRFAPAEDWEGTATVCPPRSFFFERERGWTQSVSE